jgi:hypothetical protein
MEIEKHNMNEIMSPDIMEIAVNQLHKELVATIVETSAIIGWAGAFRAIQDAATLMENGYVAGVAEAAAGFIKRHDTP